MQNNLENILRTEYAQSCILVAEDEMVNQMVVEHFLHHIGFNMTLVETGVEAVALAKAERFDLILMDIQMPEMDGFEASQQIRNIEYCKTVPIIAISANDINNERERCIQVGISDFLPKPYTYDELYAMMFKWLSEKA